MLKITINEIIANIKEKTGLEESVIQKKIDEKVEELSGLVSKEGAAHIVANEFGVQLFKPTDTGRLQIKNIIPGLKSVSFIARVLKIYPVREFKTEKREGKVASFLVGDETGRMRVVFWGTNHIKLLEEGTLKEGELVKITNCYVKEAFGGGGVEVHSSSRSKIELNPKGGEKIPKFEKIMDSAQRTSISNIEEGAHEIRGVIVHIFETNPFFEICPDCKKRARDQTCVEHGNIEPDHSLVLSTIIDDGSGNMRVVFFGNRSEKILGLTAKEAYKISNENSDPLYILKTKKPEMLGKEIVVEGNVATNSFSGDLEMISRKVFFPNPVIEANKIMKEVQ